MVLVVAVRLAEILIVDGRRVYLRAVDGPLRVLLKARTA
jgi:hypothetical protein